MRPAVPERGGMEELAAAAAAVAIATDANANEVAVLGSTSSTSMDVEAQEAADECLHVDKENDTVNPADRDVGAANPKVVHATLEPCSAHHAQPLA